MRTSIIPHLITLLVAVLAVLAAPAQFVTLEGRQFMVDGQPFYPRVMNYGMDLAAPSLPIDGTNAYLMHATPEGGYGPSVHSHWECMGTPACLAQFGDDLDALSTAGFNAVRFGIGPYLRQDGGRRYTLNVVHLTSTNDWHPRITIDMEPTFTGPVCDRYFAILRELLDELHTRSMKAILLVADDASQEAGIQLVPTADIAASEQFAAFLRRLAFELRDHPALFAYDLWNEPIYTTTNFSMLEITKESVCEHTSRWYDAIREHDPNHLVTLGGAGYNELQSWDPAVMKLDFYSPHPYPEPLIMDAYDHQQDLERIKAHLHWLAAASPMPWLIGETGFAAEDDRFDPLNSTDSATGLPCHLSTDTIYHSMPWMHGEESEQRDFAIQTMDATHNYLGSGYSWWGFQNTRASWLCTQPYASVNASHYRSNFWGIYKFGNDVTYPNLPPWNSPHVRRPKLVVESFANYTPPVTTGVLPPPPSTYSQWFATPRPFIREYTVRDQFAQPIPYALADANWIYQPNGLGSMEPIPLWRPVFAGEDGVLRISAPPEHTGYFPASFLIVKVSAPGSTHEQRSGLSIRPTGSNIPLHREEFLYSTTIVDDHIVNETAAERKAWNDLTVTNSTVINSGSALSPVTFHARSSVHLTGEFHAAVGSEFRALTEQTFARPCDQPAFKMAVPDATSFDVASNQHTRESPGILRLQFQRSRPEVRLYPNPCKDFVWMDIGDEVGNCIVHDTHGRILIRTTVSAGTSVLPLANLAAGAYTVRIVQPSGSSTVTLIKLP